MERILLMRGNSLPFAKEVPENYLSHKVLSRLSAASLTSTGGTRSTIEYSNMHGKHYPQCDFPAIVMYKEIFHRRLNLLIPVRLRSALQFQLSHLQLQGFLPPMSRSYARLSTTEGTL